MVTGLVVDELDTGVAGILVLVNDVPEAVTDTAGRFSMGDVPVGQHLIRTSAIGFELDARLLRLQEGDSVDLTLRVERTHVPIDGAGFPLPGLDRLRDATSLLPVLLASPEVTAAIEGSWSDLGDGDTLRVIAGWKTNADTVVIGRAPTLEIVRNCPGCVAQEVSTLEGGPAYIAGERHLNIGVKAAGVAGGIGTPRVHFCIALAQPDDFLFKSCGGLTDRAFEIVYWQREPRDWMVVDWQ